MKLNNYSYCHVEIKKYCSQLELLTGMKLATNLNEDFEEIRFVNKLGYLVVDFKKEAIFTLAHHITDIEFKILKNLMIDLTWLYVGHRVFAQIDEAQRNEKSGKPSKN